MITNTPAVAYLNCQTVSQQLVADRPRSYQVRVRRLLHHRRLRDAQRTTAIAADCDRTRLDDRTGHPGSIDPDDGRPRQTHVYLDPPAGKPSACGADRSRGTASRRGSRFPIRTTVNSMRVHPAGVKLHGVMVKPYWSNTAGHCVTPAPPTVETCESHLPTLATSHAHIRLALPRDATARLGTTTERRGRAAKRRPRTRGASSARWAPLTPQEAR